jgi:hypothetical protein
MLDIIENDLVVQLFDADSDKIVFGVEPRQLDLKVNKHCYFTQINDVLWSVWDSA